MLPKLKKFVSTHIPHILCTIALVVFTTLAMTMVYNAHNATSQDQTNLLNNQMSSSSINSINATKSATAFKANNTDEAEKLLTSLQKSLSAQNQNLAVTSSNLETQSGAYSIFGIIVPSVVLYVFLGLAALSLLLLIIYLDMAELMDYLL